MPSLIASSPRRKPRLISDDEQAGVKQEVLGSRKGKKRARIQESQGGESEEDEHKHVGKIAKMGNGVAAVDSSSSGEHEGNVLVRDKSGYVTGSITRVAAENFVTYDKVQFAPGPALNMILGPNGTGKSTIACAIALGLGFSPKVLGRSTKISEFVKLGTKEGWIEVELKGHPGKPNTVIRRYIFKDKEGTTFFLDGKETTAKAVASKMEQLNVQVGNLCTFLPQDRVATFAAMSIPDRLKETEKAAGDRRLSGWHTELIEHHQQLSLLRQDVSKYEEQLKRRLDKQAANKREVEQFQQRKEIQTEISLINLLIPFAEYSAAREAWAQGKEERNIVEQELKELEAKNQPFMDSLEALTNAKNIYDQQRKNRNSDISKLDKVVKEKFSSIAKADTDVKTVRDELRNIKREEAERVKRLAATEEQIAALQLECENEPPASETKALDQAITEVDKQKRKLQNEIDANAQKNDDLDVQVQNLNNEKARIEKQLGALNSVQSQRDKQCQQFEPSTWAGVEFLRNNLSRFKGKVYEPPRLCLYPRDRQTNIKIAESPISNAAWKTFVFEETEDYELMMAEMNDSGRMVNNKRIRINGAVLPDGRRQLADHPKVLSEDQMKAMGLDCYATDLLSGPEAVLAYLCHHHSLHQYPLCIRPNAQINTAAIESANIPRYYTLDGSHSIKRSAYGARNTQVETRALLDPKILAGGSNTSSALAELNAKVSDIKKQLQRLAAEVNKHGKLDAEFQAQIEEIKARRVELTQEKAAQTRAQRLWHTAKAKLHAAKDTLRRLQKMPSADKQRESLQTKLATLTTHKILSALELKRTMMKITALRVKLADEDLRQLQVEGDLRAMTIGAAERGEALGEKRKEYQDIVSQVSELFQKAKDISARAFAAMELAAEDIRVAAEDRREKQENLQQLTNELIRLDAELKCTVPISEVVLKQYEAREKEIEDYKQKLSTAAEQLTEANELIDSIQQKWLPRLQDLVQKISSKFAAAFDHLGLLGEIRILKDADYDKWGIDILVSFRDGEPLQSLSSHRQSGGERALSTVMYLMSLAELAQAPFALVDEINQGMDQRVERQVHNALVKTTCTGDVGQYFLITPKLLSNLEYHSKMKVLIINNGDWLPVHFNLAKLVKAQLKRKAK